MAYEIPQQLQHKERILFGLTFQQLGWVFLFGLMVLLIFSSGGSFAFRFVLSLLPASLGVLFVFFDVNRWLKNVFAFLRFRGAVAGGVKMDRLLGIRKVDGGCIVGDVAVAVLRVVPINYGIKTDDDKGGIIAGFQKFLNSLDFRVQFVVSSRELNIDEYLRSLSGSQCVGDFSAFMKETISKNQIRNREFYLVIPKVSDLDIQVRVCQERLRSIGLKCERLTTSELLRMLQLFFGADKKVASQSGQDGTSHLISPGRVFDRVDYLEVDDKFCRIITATGYPRLVDAGFLDKIISSNDDFDISLHIEPFSIETMMVLLNRELQKQRADLYGEELKKSINPALEIKYQDTRRVMEELQKGEQKLFNISFYINCKGKTKSELDLLTQKVVSELNSMMIVPHKAVFQQIPAYQSMFPSGKDALSVKRNITTKALSAFFPFTSPFLTLEPGGVMLGLNKNKVPYIKDIYALSNANGVVLATSGSGKSYFTKLLISRHLQNNAQITVIDPQGEYTGLTQASNGCVVTISRTSETILNPLDLMGHDYVEKRLALMDLFQIMFGDLSEIQKSILDKAVNETYAKCGINADTFIGKTPPILGDLYKTLLKMDKSASQQEKVTYRALINRLYMYVDGVFGFMNKQSNINYDNRFVTFNIGDMPKQVKPVIMFLILDYAYLHMKQTPGKKFLVIDEAWSLLGRAEEASYIFEIVKTCRKYNMGLLLITQDVADLLGSKAGGAVLANSSYTFLLRQKPSIIASVVRTFNLSDAEKDYLLTAIQGRGILILDNEHQELEVIASPQEHALITTNPNEIITQNNETQGPEKLDINLDVKKGLFWGVDLSVDEKNYLANHKYKVASFVPIGKTRQEECWVKENKVESLEHTFLVQNIYEYLQNFTDKIEVNVVQKPDIVFQNAKGKSIALEVETGKSFRKTKRKLKEKFSAAKNEFPNLRIVLTNTNFKRHYTLLCPDIPLLVRTDLESFIQSQFIRGTGTHSKVGKFGSENARSARKRAS